MKTVHELRQEELEELRLTFYEQFHIDNDTEFPMSDVITHYEGTFFVEEDFFCNLSIS
jgi:hypothetical protein